MSEHEVAEYLCIGCPLGCRLEVEEVHKDDGAEDAIEVRGFTCKKGKEYGRQEHTDPRRVVTTTVGLRGGDWQRLPVKTSAAVPKGLVRDVCRALRRIEVETPIAVGTVILPNVLDTGIDVVATRDL